LSFRTGGGSKIDFRFSFTDGVKLQNIASLNWKSGEAESISN
jgi:hypothetical protein